MAAPAGLAGEAVDLGRFWLVSFITRCLEMRWGGGSLELFG